MFLLNYQQPKITAASTADPVTHRLNDVLPTELGFLQKHMQVRAKRVQHAWARAEWLAQDNDKHGRPAAVSKPNCKMVR